ncbi:hypothetical protein [Kosakonia sacchari]|uniref:Inner membrane protein n=1 Tax=Kosakonia sacchari TaxID=1158459 RepID=A0A1G4XUU3_9ENTR|nr:hypothetical protein [Kosakonia sacchari]AHJ73564.1 hypothetical protein C813_01350 [Kosakonia sacchari SP1]MDN2486443.1 hypothetical protein [Kosakonia sacchari]SCX44982.1 hypothetical protein SAMN02927897_01480 [Kosakonia sacchari]
MAGVIALVYFASGTVFFTQKIRLFAFVSAFILYMALHIAAASALLTGLLLACLLSTFVILLPLKRPRDKKAVLHFSLPCWLLIVSVIYDVFVSQPTPAY